MNRYINSSKFGDELLFISNLGAAGSAGPLGGFGLFRQPLLLLAPRALLLREPSGNVARWLSSKMYLENFAEFSSEFCRML